jgi:putative ABC transport system permease protein
MWNDLRSALRLFRTNRAFATVAIFSIAIGIGIDTATFSVLDAVFTRPLVGVDTRNLVYLTPGDAVTVGPGGFPWSDYAAFREECRSMEVAASTTHGVGSPVSPRPGPRLAVTVSWNYFSVLAIRPVVGRVFGESDRGDNLMRPAVISHAFWHRAWGGDPAVIGQQLKLHSGAHTIVGVAPPGFRGTQRWSAPDLWLPVRSGTAGFGDERDRSFRGFTFVARLRPGYTREQAQGEAHTVFSRLQSLYPPAQRPEPIRVLTMERAAWESGGALMIYVMPVVSLVLLVACANVSILLLARHAQRRQEWAIRLALGARRWHLVRHQLAESLLLSCAGMGAGLVLGAWLVTLLPHFLFSSPGAAADLQCDLDRRALLVTIGLTLATAVVAGLAPSLRMADANLTPALKSDFSVEPGRPSKLSLRNLLVIGQLAVAFVFVTIAGLLVHALLQSLASETKLPPREIVLVEFRELEETNRRPLAEYLSDLRERLEKTANARSTSLASEVPATGFGGSAAARAFVDDDSRRARGEAFRAVINTVDTNLFEVLGWPLQAGRPFDSRDLTTGSRTVVVGEALSRRFWPGDNPVGQHLRLQSVDAPPLEIVGVVRDGDHSQATERNMFNLYLPYRASTRDSFVLLVEAPGKAKDYVRVVEQGLRGEDPGVAPERIDTLAGARRRMAVQSARLLWPLIALGGLALAMALAGLYALMSWSVVRRTHEIGLRMALGASRADALRLMVKDGVRLVAGGILVGAPIAAAIAQALWSFAPIIRSAFLVVAPLAVIVVFCIGTLAACLPARRAMKVDPMTALRCE